MSFEQTYYTSCENGLGDGKGFQFKAVSAGIEPLLLAQIEPLGLYEPPLSFPSQPTPEELKQFPISLSFQTLDDGSAILGQAKYVGTDYTNRYGNFFSHSLVSQSPHSDFSQQNKLLPIQTWRSEFWVETEETTSELPVVSNIFPGVEINHESVVSFLNDPVRRKIFPDFLTAVVEALKTNRRIIIVDDNENIAFWIAAASYALPYHFVMKLTFNTYVRDPYLTRALIAGTTDDTTFNFANHEIEHQFFVFDFKGARFTPFTHHGGFAATVAFAYRNSYSLSQFARFVENCAPNLPLEELEPAFTVYCCLTDIDLPDFSNAEVMTWSSRYLENLVDNDIQTLLAKIVSRKPTDTETLNAFTKFHLAALQAQLQPHTKNSIRTVYFQWLILEGLPNIEVSALAATAKTLPRETYDNDHSEPLVEAWLKSLKDSDHPERFAAALLIGDKLGFADKESSVLSWLGTNVSQLWGAHQSVQWAVCQVAVRAGGRNLIEGIAADLVSRINEPHFFASLSTLIEDQNAFNVLKNYAVESQNIPLYLRLSGTQANLESARREPTESLLSALTDINKLFNEDITPEITEEAFRAIWITRTPTLREGVQLLQPPLLSVVAKTGIPAQLLDVLCEGDGKFSAPDELDLLSRLASREVAERLGDKAAMVNALVIAAELQHNFSDPTGRKLEEYLNWLTEASPRLFGYGPQLYKLIGQKAARVKEPNMHARLLYEHLLARNEAFLKAYEKECEEVVKTKNNHAEVLSMVMAWLTIRRRDRPVIGSRLSAWAGLLEKHKGKRDLEKIGNALSTEPELQRQWLILREEHRQNNPGLLTRLKDNIFSR